MLEGAKVHDPEPVDWVCPGCHASIVQSTRIGGPTVPGSLALCVECYVWLVFTTDLRLVVLPNDRWLALQPIQREFLTALRAHVMQA